MRTPVVTVGVNPTDTTVTNGHDGFTRATDKAVSRETKPFRVLVVSWRNHDRLNKTGTWAPHAGVSRCVLGALRPLGTPIGLY